MPSLIISNRSGGDLIVSGDPWAGSHPVRPAGKFPQGGIQLRWDRSASGNVYIGLSGGVTIQSGQMIGSGGVSSGLLDGMQLGPGDAYWIPDIAFPSSGVFNVYGMCDQAASGLGRLYFEIF